MVVHQKGFLLLEFVYGIAFFIVISSSIALNYWSLLQELVAKRTLLESIELAVSVLTKGRMDNQVSTAQQSLVLSKEFCEPFKQSLWVFDDEPLFVYPQQFYYKSVQVEKGNIIVTMATIEKEPLHEDDTECSRFYHY